MSDEKYFQYAENMFPLFFAILKFCSAKHLFKLSLHRVLILFSALKHPFINKMNVNNSLYSLILAIYSEDCTSIKLFEFLMRIYHMS